MDGLTARPQVLKQANLALIRKVLKLRGTATRAEITAETEISATTVRSLLTGMAEDGEVESVGYDLSSGGRKAERYRLRPGRHHGVAFCIRNDQVHALLVDACGEIVETTILEAPGGEPELVMTAFLDELTAHRRLKSIGIGVPGVVEGGSFWRKEKGGEAFYKADLGDHLARRYGIPVVMENDINAVTIGFGLCYEKEFPRERPEDTNMAYLHFEHSCVSAGFLAGGRVIRGSRNFAGELGLVPQEGGKLLDDCMGEPMDEQRYIDRMVQTVGWVCGVLNPEYIALGGPALRKECIGPIGDGLSSLLPWPMQAELLYAPDVWGDYHEGMAHLTAEKMFDEVRLVKE